MTLRYRVVSTSELGTEVDIEVLLGPEGEFVRVKARGHGERAVLSMEQGVRFLEAMERLHPETIPKDLSLQLTEEGEDGMDFMGAYELTCHVSREDGSRHKFRGCGPTTQTSRRKAFISLVVLLALDVVRHPETISLLRTVCALVCLPLPPTS